MVGQIGEQGNANEHEALYDAPSGIIYWLDFSRPWRNTALVKGSCCSLISATRRNLKTPTLMRSFSSCSSIFGGLDYRFGGHVVLGSRALKNTKPELFHAYRPPTWIKFLYITESHLFDSQANWVRPPFTKEKCFVHHYWSIRLLEMDKYFEPFKTPAARVLSDIIFSFHLIKHSCLCIKQWLNCFKNSLISWIWKPSSVH